MPKVGTVAPRVLCRAISLVRWALAIVFVLSAVQAGRDTLSGTTSSAPH